MDFIRKLWERNYIFHWQIKYSSKLLSRHAFGFIRDNFLYCAFIGWIRSRISSPTNTFKITVHPGLRNSRATSRIARLSSIDLYWSTPVIPVVDGAISDVIQSNCSTPRVLIYARIASYSNTLSCNRWIFGNPKFGSIFWISIPTTIQEDPTIFAITWRKLPGAAPTSNTFILGCRILYLSWISRSLKALLARYQSSFAFLK